MKFTSTPLSGAYTVDLEKRNDERGFFARFFCVDEMAKQGLETEFIQVNNSLSSSEGTLRGMHYQLPPFQEVKLVRCLRGALYDVILDLRPHSPTMGNWFGATLTAENRTMMYVPKGFAHGFLTLEPDTEVLYLVSAPYSKERERGVRWEDPRFQMEWPMQPQVISERDKSHPLFDFHYHLDAAIE